jgi:hypothetical protein
MSALSSYRRTLGPDSTLLIYYAGHGYSDPAVDKTYWWPVDAQPGDVSEWISADDITTSIKAMTARHVLVVSDSCFAGTLSRGTATPRNELQAGDRAIAINKMRERPSRELLASGGNEPVDDGGGGDHSIFADAFLRALRSMVPTEFTVEEIFREVRESVGGRSGQLPQLDPLRNSGHDGGSFVFSRVAAIAPGATADKFSGLRQESEQLRGFYEKVDADNTGEIENIMRGKGCQMSRVDHLLSASAAALNQWKDSEMKYWMAWGNSDTDRLEPEQKRLVSMESARKRAEELVASTAKDREEMLVRLAELKKLGGSDERVRRINEGIVDLRDSEVRLREVRKTYDDLLLPLRNTEASMSERLVDIRQNTRRVEAYALQMGADYEKTHASAARNCTVP